MVQNAQSGHKISSRSLDWLTSLVAPSNPGARGGVFGNAYGARGARVLCANTSAPGSGRASGAAGARRTDRPVPLQTGPLPPSHGQGPATAPPAARRRAPAPTSSQTDQQPPPPLLLLRAAQRKGSPPSASGGTRP